MISPYLIYLLGILTILIPLSIFYVLSIIYFSFNTTWHNIFCTIVV